jgi:hypothetical protein
MVKGGTKWCEVEAKEYQLGGRKSKQTFQSFFPQNNKWGFSLCPSLTSITSDKYTSYGKMSKLKTTWFESRRGRADKGILRRKR